MQVHPCIKLYVLGCLLQDEEERPPPSLSCLTPVRRSRAREILKECNRLARKEAEQAADDVSKVEAEPKRGSKGKAKATGSKAEEPKEDREPLSVLLDKAKHICT